MRGAISRRLDQIEAGRAVTGRLKQRQEELDFIKAKLDMPPDFDREAIAALALAHLHKIGRIIMQWTLNHLEADDLGQAPAEVGIDQSSYRRRPASPRRGDIATLFGMIALWRLR